ncbi:MAG: N-acetyltransferase family protein [Limisphaerales bacterium]
MTCFHIRSGRERDCSEIARLASQLGYPVSGEAMRTRLRSLLASPGNVVLVAESADGELVGWIHGVLSQFLDSDRRVEIGGLVVDERHHRRGVGRDLVERVEAWAVEHGVMQALVRCQTRRAEAHTFYGSLGYAQSKTQIVSRKPLSLQCKPSPEKKRI